MYGDENGQKKQAKAQTHEAKTEPLLPFFEVDVGYTDFADGGGDLKIHAPDRIRN